MTFDELPDVIPDRTLAEYFGRSRRSIQFRRAQGTWPLPELPGLKCHTSKRALGRYLDGESIVKRRTS